MDITLAFFALVALAVMPFFGVTGLISQLTENVGIITSEKWTKLRLGYVRIMATKVRAGLLYASILHCLFLCVMVALIVMQEKNEWQHFILPVLATIVAIALELVLRYFQGPAVVKYHMGPNGEPLLHPEYILDTHNHALAANGNALRVNDQGQPIAQGGRFVVLNEYGNPFAVAIPIQNGQEVPDENVPVDTDLLIEHPMAGKPQIIRDGFRPSSLKTGWSVILVMTTFLMNALVTLLVGTWLQSTAIVLLGLAQMILVIAPLKLICELFGWAFERGIDFVEFAGSLAASQILPLLAGITVGSVKPFDLGNQKAGREFIRNLPNLLTANSLSIFAWVLVSPTPEMLTIVTLAATVSAITAVPYMLNGGSSHVKTTIAAFFKLQYAVVPSLVVGRVIWELIPKTGGQASNFKNRAQLLWDGHKGIPILGWEALFALAAIGTVGLWLFSGTVREWLNGKGWVSEKFAALYGLFGLLLFLGTAWSFVSAVGRVFEATEVRLPRVIDEEKRPKPPVITSIAMMGDGSPRVNWIDQADNEKEFRVEYQKEGTTGFAFVGTVPANSQNFTVPELMWPSPGSNTIYRVVAVNPDGRGVSEPMAHPMPSAASKTIVPAVKAETVAAPVQEKPVATAEEKEEASDEYNYGEKGPGWDAVLAQQSK